MKVRARAGNPVQIGGLQTRWTTRVETYAVAALLVGHDEQDIWSRVWHIVFLMVGPHNRAYTMR